MSAFDDLRVAVAGGLGVTFKGIELGSIVTTLMDELSAVRAELVRVVEQNTADHDRIEAWAAGRFQGVEEDSASTKMVMEQIRPSILAATEIRFNEITELINEHATAQETSLELHRQHTTQASREMQEDAEQRLKQLQSMTQSHMEQERTESQQRHDDLFGKMKSMQRKQTEIVGMNLNKALRGNLRATYFATWVQFVMQKRAERRKANNCKRLLFRSQNFQLKCCFENWVNYTKKKRKQAARIRHLRAMCGNTERGALRIRYQAWVAFREAGILRRKEERAQQEACVRALMDLVSTGTMRYCFLLLQKHRKLRQEQVLKVEMARAFSINVLQGKKQQIWDLWMRARVRHNKMEEGRRAVEVFNKTLSTAIRRAYFAKLMKNKENGDQKKQLTTALAALRLHSDKGRKLAFYEVWKQAAEREMQRREKLRLAETIGRSIPHSMKQYYYTKWQEALAAHNKEKHRKQLLAAKKAEDMGFRKRIERELLKYTFGVWLAFRNRNVSSRSTLAASAHMDNIAQKTDSLWQQLEIHQKTVSNTNSCVQRLVDKLLLVDDSLDKLDKSKVNRKEMRSLVELCQHNAYDASNADSDSVAGSDTLPKRGYDAGARPYVDHSPRSGGAGEKVYAHRNDASALSQGFTIPPPPPHPRVDDIDLAYAKDTVARLAARTAEMGVPTTEPTNYDPRRPSVGVGAYVRP